MLFRSIGDGETDLARGAFGGGARDLDRHQPLDAFAVLDDEQRQIAHHGLERTAESGETLVAGVGNRIYLAGNLHSPAVTMFSALLGSDDSGLTWSEPREISDSVRKQGWRWYATGPGGVEQLAGGRMLVPCNHTHPRQKGGSRSHTIYSDDGGETWQLGGQIDAPGTNEGQLAQRPDGAVLLYMRNQPHGRKQLAVSTDDGATWSSVRRILDFDSSVPGSQGNGVGDPAILVEIGRAHV